MFTLKDRVMAVIFAKGIRCPKIISKARSILDSVEKGLIRPRKLVVNKASVVNIGLRHRAVQPKGSYDWTVMTHEAYNNFCS